MKDDLSIQLRVDVVFFQIPQNLSVVPHDIEAKTGRIKGIFKTVRVNQLTIGNRHHSICQRLGGEFIPNQRGGKVAQMAVREGGQIAETMQLIKFQSIKGRKPIQSW